MDINEFVDEFAKQNLLNENGALPFNYRNSIDFSKNFLAFLEEAGVDAETIKTITPYILSKKGMDADFRGGLDLDRKPTEPNPNDTLIDFLRKQKQELGDKKFCEELIKMLISAKKDCDRYEQNPDPADSKRTCFKNAFIKQLVVAHKDLVEIAESGVAIKDLSINSLDYVAKLKFAGVSIARITIETDEQNQQILCGHDFRTLPGLENIGIGGYLFAHACEEIKENRPESGLLAWNVSFKGRGHTAYAAWGAHYVASDTDLTPITEEDSKRIAMEIKTGFHLMFFSPEVVKKVAERPKKYGPDSKTIQTQK